MKGKMLGAIVGLVVSLSLLGQVGADWSNRCPDFTGDGQVTLEDAYVVVSYFGTYPGMTQANEDGNYYVGKYDLNHSRNITVSDIMLVLVRIGEEC